MSCLIDRSSTAVVGCSLIVVEKTREQNPRFPGFTRPQPRMPHRLEHKLRNEPIFPPNANKLNPLITLESNRITKPLPGGRGVLASPEFSMAHRGRDPAGTGAAMGCSELMN